MTDKTIPVALAQISAGRDFITTNEFARTISRAKQTIRKTYCYNGHVFGIVPCKFGNRLLWPVVEVAALLNGSAPK